MSINTFLEILQIRWNIFSLQEQNVLVGLSPEEKGKEYSKFICPLKGSRYFFPLDLHFYCNGHLWGCPQGMESHNTFLLISMYLCIWTSLHTGHWGIILGTWKPFQHWMTLFVRISEFQHHTYFSCLFCLILSLVFCNPHWFCNLCNAF